MHGASQGCAMHLSIHLSTKMPPGTLPAPSQSQRLIPLQERPRYYLPPAPSLGTPSEGTGEGRWPATGAEEEVEAWLERSSLGNEGGRRTVREPLQSRRVT